MKRPLESSPDVKNVTFHFILLGENEKPIWLGLTSEVPVASRCSQRPRFPLERWEQAARCGCCALIVMTPREFGTTGAGGMLPSQPGKKGQLPPHKSNHRRETRSGDGPQQHHSVSSEVGCWSGGFITPGKAFSPPLGSSTDRANALPHPCRCGAGASAQAGPIMGPEVRIRAGCGGGFSFFAPLLPL